MNYRRCIPYERAQEISQHHIYHKDWEFKYLWGNHIFDRFPGTDVDMDFLILNKKTKEKLWVCDVFGFGLNAKPFDRVEVK